MRLFQGAVFVDAFFAYFAFDRSFICIFTFFYRVCRSKCSTNTTKVMPSFFKGKIDPSLLFKSSSKLLIFRKKNCIKFQAAYLLTRTGELEISKESSEIFFEQKKNILGEHMV